MSTYLAFDLGASSGRGIIGKFENNRLELSEVHRFSNGPVEKNGSLFWDIELQFSEIKTGIRKALTAGHKISGIAIDTWGVDYALLGKNGKFIRNPYHYRDARTNEAPANLFKIMPFEKVYERTGIQFMQLNSLYQLFAHKEQHPEDLKDSTFLLMPDALSYMLCGKVECEYTDASTTQLLDAKKGNWDFELIEKTIEELLNENINFNILLIDIDQKTKKKHMVKIIMVLILILILMMIHLLDHHV